MGKSLLAAWVLVVSLAHGDSLVNLPPPATTIDDANRTFDARLRSALARNVTQPLYDGKGDEVGHAILARLAYRDYFTEPSELDRGDRYRAEANTALLNATVRSRVGTDIHETIWCPPFGLPCITIDRTGDYDVLLTAYTTILYKYHIERPVLTAEVANHILHRLLTKRGPFSREDMTIEMAGVVIPETENHILMIYVAWYLTNQILFQRGGEREYDNASNGMTNWMLEYLKEFLKRDFIEYNSRNYQYYSMSALLNLYSYSFDPRVKVAAQMVLDYVSAKVAVSSNDARRHVPYRRKAEKFSKELLESVPDGPSIDPQTAIFMMLAGTTQIRRFDHSLPGSMAPEFQIVGLSDYRIPPLIHDLFVTSGHRNFYQRFRYCSQGCRGCQLECIEEIYFGSPSFLISAGGHLRSAAYVVDLPDGLPGLSKDDDLGIPVATTIMPTGIIGRAPGRSFGRSVEDFIRFEVGALGVNLGVAPNFATGFRWVIPEHYTANPTRSRRDGNWLFIDQSGIPHGFYVAAYLTALERIPWPSPEEPLFYLEVENYENRWGFVEVHDTAIDGELSFDEFASGVLRRNGWRTFINKERNEYVTTAGRTIEFLPGVILSIDGTPQGDGFTKGSIINSDGAGLVTIDNPCFKTRLNLDLRDPLKPARSETVRPAPVVWVDLDFPYFPGIPEFGTFEWPFHTLRKGVIQCPPCGVINMFPGSGGERLVITKPLLFEAPLGPAVVIP